MEKVLDLVNLTIFYLFRFVNLCVDCNDGSGRNFIYLFLVDLVEWSAWLARI